MASISSTSGLRTIQFVGADKKRRSIRLGKLSLELAREFKLHVSRLIESKATGLPLHAITAGWLRLLEDKYHNRLARVGLCEPREVGLRGHMPLAKMLDNYIARRTDLKDWSVKMLKQTRDKLIEHFGESKPIGSITAADAIDFKRKRLMTDSQAYVAKQIQLSRQFFKHAVDDELLDRSPFAKIPCGSQKNKARQRFIPREMIDRAIDKAPDIEWKLIIAFARYGGLRVPSEILALRWSHIDWTEGKIKIIASKTEHHVGREERDIPLFPELEPLLLEAKELVAGSEDGFVITKSRDATVNLRSRFLDILSAAGIEPWPKLFQNLRSTRQTELTEDFPAHVVCAWLGNSEKVADEHYLQVTPAHFGKARGIAGDANLLHRGAKSGAASPCFASQDATPYVLEESASLDVAGSNENVLADGSTCEIAGMGAVGFEPTKA
jgi:integrase